MRIAQVAPLYESVPPKLYGGTERVVSYLTEGLVELGHEATLFATADSKTKANLIAPCEQALWQDENYREWLPYELRLMELVFKDLSRFEVIHFHADYIQFPFLRRQPWANITTMHGRLHAPDLKPLFDEYAEMPLVPSPTINADLCRTQTGKRPFITDYPEACTACMKVLVSTWHSLVAFLRKSGWIALSPSPAKQV